MPADKWAWPSVPFASVSFMTVLFSTSLRFFSMSTLLIDFCAMTAAMLRALGLTASLQRWKQCQDWPQATRFSSRQLRSLVCAEFFVLAAAFACGN